MTQKLAGRVAVITGASSGIGAAVARAFAAEGARIVVAARRKERLEALAAELSFADVLVRPTDLMREEEILGLFEEAENFGPVDLLVNNAGAGVASSVVDSSLEDWRRLIDLNLTAPFLCAREAMRRMIPRRRGRIINVGSISGLVPRGDGVAYTVSKFGLEGLTRGLALEGRPHGVTVSIIRPGGTQSELAAAADPSVAVGPSLMAAASVAGAIVMMAALPDEANLLEATLLPIAQPFLGRG